MVVRIGARVVDRGAFECAHAPDEAHALEQVQRRVDRCERETRQLGVDVVRRDVLRRARHEAVDHQAREGDPLAAGAQCLRQYLVRLHVLRIA
jgi:hypothetical protein